MKLLVGLGNPGAQYAGNRHNIGFMALDRIADEHRAGSWRRRFQAHVSEATVGGERVLLVKPDTFMNLSGQAVAEACQFYKVEPADVIALHDELDLAPGDMRVKLGGGNAGHNGLKSISQHIGNEYVRVRLGIGHPGAKELVAGYVLHDFAKADREWLDPLLDQIAREAPLLVAGDVAGFQRAVRGDAAPAAKGKGQARQGGKEQPAGDPNQRSRPSGSGGHPAGERATKRQTALAANLQKWLAGRKPPGGSD